MTHAQQAIADRLLAALRKADHLLDDIELYEELHTWSVVPLDEIKTVLAILEKEKKIMRNAQGCYSLR